MANPPAALLNASDREIYGKEIRDRFELINHQFQVSGVVFNHIEETIGNAINLGEDIESSFNSFTVSKYYPDFTRLLFGHLGIMDMNEYLWLSQFMNRMMFTDINGCQHSNFQKAFVYHYSYLAPDVKHNDKLIRIVAFLKGIPTDLCDMSHILVCISIICLVKNQFSKSLSNIFTEFNHQDLLFQLQYYLGTLYTTDGPTHFSTLVDEKFIDAISCNISIMLTHMSVHTKILLSKLPRLYGLNNPPEEKFLIDQSRDVFCIQYPSFSIVQAQSILRRMYSVKGKYPQNEIPEPSVDREDSNCSECVENEPVRPWVMYKLLEILTDRPATENISYYFSLDVLDSRYKSHPTINVANWEDVDEKIALPLLTEIWSNFKYKYPELYDMADEFYSLYFERYLSENHDQYKREMQNMVELASDVLNDIKQASQNVVKKSMLHRSQSVGGPVKEKALVTKIQPFR